MRVTAWGQMLAVGGWQERPRGYGGGLTAPATNLHLLLTTGTPGWEKVGRRVRATSLRLPEDRYVFQNKKLKKNR